MGKTKTELLSTEVRHIEIKKLNFAALSDQAKNTAHAAKIYEKMLLDKDCSAIHCLADSLVSAGLNTAVAENN